MFRFFKIAISFLLATSLLNAGANDSLKDLTRSKVDTIRIDAYLKLSKLYRNVNIDTSLIYLTQAEKELGIIASAYDSLVLMRWSYNYANNKALYFQETDQFDSVLQYYNTMITLSKQMHNSTLLGNVYNNLGVFHEQQSKYAEALDFYLKAYRLYDSLNDPLTESKVLVNIGVIYYRQGEYAEALEYYEKALPLKREVKDQRGEALVYNNMGIVYYYLENYDKVLENFKRSLNIYRQLGDIRSQAMPYYNIAEIYKEQNRLKEALYYYKKAHDIEMQLGDISGQAETLSTIGYIYLDMKKPADAIRVQKEAVRLLQGLGARRELADALRALSATYELLKQPEQALSYYKQFKAQHDSLNNSQKAKEIAKVKEAYESEKKDHRIELLSERNKIMEVESARQQAILVAQRRMTILSLVVASLVLFGLIMIYRLYQQKRLSNQLLEFKNRAINRKNEEISKMVINLEQAISAREVFFSNATHELRTPLNIVNGFTNLLMNSVSDDKQAYYLKNIKSSSSHLLRLIEDMLAVSQMESGFLRLQYESVDLKEYVQYVVSPFEILAAQRNLKFEFSIASDCPAFVKIDPLRYQQIIANLVDNAIKYTPRNGFVSLSFTYENSYLQLQVKDSGVGIDSADLKDVFNRYERGANTVNAGAAGIGLGLNIVKQLAELQKGTLQVESIPGEGSVFTVAIFAESMQKATYRVSADAKILPSDKMRYGRILLVDDNLSNLELTIDILNVYMSTLVIDTATNGAKALELLRKNKYNLVLLDLKMPDMSGFEVANSLRSSEFANVPVVAMSAQVNAETRQKCKEHGMIGFIEKPYEPVQLINEIERINVFTSATLTDDSLIIPSARKFMQPDELNRIVEVSVPDFLQRLNSALRNKDWDAIAKILPRLRSELELFDKQEFKDCLNLIEKECFTTREISRAATVFQKLTGAWDTISKVIGD